MTVFITFNVLIFKNLTTDLIFLQIHPDHTKNKNSLDKF